MHSLYISRRKINRFSVQFRKTRISGFKRLKYICIAKKKAINRATKNYFRRPFYMSSFCVFIPREVSRQVRKEYKVSLDYPLF